MFCSKFGHDLIWEPQKGLVDMNPHQNDVHHRVPNAEPLQLVVPGCRVRSRPAKVCTTILVRVWSDANVSFRQRSFPEVCIADQEELQANITYFPLLRDGMGWFFLTHQESTTGII